MLRLLVTNGAASQSGSCRETGLDGHGWSNVELAEFWRCASLLSALGLPVEFDHGVSDQGDPWGVFVNRLTEDVIVHIVRADGRVALICPPLAITIEGATIRETVSRFFEHPSLRDHVAMSEKRRAMTNVRFLPAALLAAIVSIALLAAEEAQANGWESVTSAGGGDPQPKPETPEKPTVWIGRSVSSPLSWKGVADHRSSVALRGPSMVAAAQGDVVVPSFADVLTAAFAVFSSAPTQVLLGTVLPADGTSGTGPEGPSDDGVSAVEEPLVRSPSPDGSGFQQVALLPTSPAIVELDQDASAQYETISSVVEDPVSRLSAETASTTPSADGSSVTPDEAAQVIQFYAIGDLGPATLSATETAPERAIVGLFDVLLPREVLRMLHDGLPAVPSDQKTIGQAYALPGEPGTIASAEPPSIIVDFRETQGNAAGTIAAVMGFLTWMLDSRTHVSLPRFEKSAVYSRLLTELPVHGSSGLRVLVVEDGPATMPSQVLMRDVVMMSIDFLPRDATPPSPDEGMILRLPGMPDLHVIGQIHLADMASGLALSV